MKTGLIIAGVIITFLIAIRLFVSSQREDTETCPYSVVKEYDDFEVRIYDANLFTSVQLPYKEYSKAGGLGFRIISTYISGENEKDELIEMTIPVMMALEDSITVMMMIPKEKKGKSLPKPDDSQIKFIEVPSKTVAAITFNHRASDAEIRLYKQKLIDALEEEKIAYTDHFYFFAYNSPLDLFNRRNEVVVELAGR